MSSAEHFPGRHDSRLDWILSFPVVHWHFVSVREQPEGGTAAAKQAMAQVGTWERSWAAARVAAAATARMEKRILKDVCGVCVCENGYVDLGIRKRREWKRRVCEGV